MMQTLRYLLCVALLVVVAQAAFIAAVMWHTAHVDIVDTARVHDSIFQTEPKMAVYASPLIARESNRPEVVILGASNAVVGLRPQQLSPLLGDVRVHNIALGQQNMRSLDHLVALLYRQTPPPQRRNLLFVIGMWNGLLVSDAQRWPTGRTDVDEELLRYGIFTASRDGLVPRFPERYLPAALESAWPFMVPFAAYAQTLRALLPSQFWPGLIAPWNPPEDESNRMQLTQAERAAQIALINDYIGPVATRGDDSFVQMTTIGARIAAEGGHLVILDLPSTTWLQRSTPSYTDYQQRKLPYLARLQKIKAVRYANLQNGFTDDDFYDGVHPRARTTAEFARRAAVPIAAALAEIHDPDPFLPENTHGIR